jgi:arsenate reductase
LEERGAAFTLREYLGDPLSAAELEDLGRRLGKPTGEWVRKGESAFKEGGLADAADEALREAIAKTPILMERPILVTADRAAIGRPPENVLELL